jgi:hypothetical protein
LTVLPAGRFRDRGSAPNSNARCARCSVRAVLSCAGSKGSRPETAEALDVSVEVVRTRCTSACSCAGVVGLLHRD